MGNRLHVVWRLACTKQTRKIAHYTEFAERFAGRTLAGMSRSQSVSSDAGGGGSRVGLPPGHQHAAGWQEARAVERAGHGQGGLGSGSGSGLVALKGNSSAMRHRLQGIPSTSRQAGIHASSPSTSRQAGIHASSPPTSRQAGIHASSPLRGLQRPVGRGMRRLGGARSTSGDRGHPMYRVSTGSTGVGRSSGRRRMHAGGRTQRKNARVGRAYRSPCMHGAVQPQAAPCRHPGTRTSAACGHSQRTAPARLKERAPWSTRARPVRRRGGPSAHHEPPPS